MSAPCLIAVDWGTTSFRAYLAAADGSIVDRVATARGILSAERAEFPSLLKAAVAPWTARHGRLAILMSGMIGSRQGWVEAPYVRCPAGPGDLSSRLTAIAVDGLGTVHVVPGLDHRDTDGRPDVMRGEETQVFGAIAAGGGADGLFVLPGTHSKWVTVEAGAIRAFATYMTGEVFAALKDHTILGRLMEGASRGGQGFAQGVAVGAEPGLAAGELLHRLFSVRTLGLMDMLGAGELADYLSGLLIGAELSAAARGQGNRFTIIASDTLAERYETAAGLLGLAAARAPADCVVAGQLKIARAAGLLKGA